MNVVLILDDQDHHDEGCSCGVCNANGKSYGVGIYPATAGGITTGEVVERVYGPSEDAAMHNAKKVAWELNYRIVKQTEDEQ